MKDWTLIVLCTLLVSPMAIASDQDVAAAITKPASQAAAPAPTAPAAGSTADSLYRVKEGNKVDARTLAGWKTWRALACERCHGASQEGLVGPALVDSLKVLTKEEFHTTIMNGRLEKGMPPFSSSKMITDNWEGLYAYLKGRSDGRIQPGRLLPLDNE